jgi:hypothetical protein
LDRVIAGTKSASYFLIRARIVFSSIKTCGDIVVRNRTNALLRGAVALLSSRIAVFVVAILAQAAPASAACVSSAGVYCDATKIQAYRGTSPYKYTGTGFTSSGVGDVIQSAGHPFNTDRLVADLTTHRGVTTLELKFYTAFNGNDLGARYADIFLGNNASKPNSFGYALSLAHQTANGGASLAGLYNVSGAGAYKTSTQIWKSKSNATYGGAFKGTDGIFRSSPVVVTKTATLKSNFTTRISETASGDASFPYLVDVKLSASNSDFLALFGAGLSVFWGTADCSNDVIQAFIAYAPRAVPEPLTASIFAAGICGLAFMRIRRKRPVKSRAAR